MDHAELLTDLGQAGIYTAPAEVAPWREAAERAGMRWLIVDLLDANDKASLLAAFARDLGFQAGFGGNWDALIDSLTELLWAAPAGSVLQLMHCERMVEHAPVVLEQALDVLDAAADDSYDEDIAFWVLVNGAGAADFDLPVLGASE